MDSPREKEIKAHDRQLEALALRKAGVQYADIATKLGYRAASGAWRAVRAALKKTLQEPAEELRVLAEARLDAMLLAIWPQAVKGSQGAIDRALRIEQRRAELRGLDAPKNLDVTSGGNKIELIVKYAESHAKSDDKSSAPTSKTS